MVPIPVLVLIIAVITALFQRFQDSSHKHFRALRRSQNFQIIVLLIEDDCKLALTRINAIINNAEHRECITIRVMEYVNHAHESIASMLTPQMRQRVTVKTCPKQSFATKRDSLKTLLDSGVMPLPSWDTRLVNAMRKAPKKAILSAPCAPHALAQFPCLYTKRSDYIVVKPRPIVVGTHTLIVPSLCCVDYWFGAPDVVFSRGFMYDGRAYAPTHPVAVRVSKTKSQRLSSLPSTHAHMCRLGLTDAPSTSECIAKYGSMTATRIAVRLAKDRATKDQIQ